MTAESDSHDRAVADVLAALPQHHDPLGRLMILAEATAAVLRSEQPQDWPHERRAAFAGAMILDMLDGRPAAAATPTAKGKGMLNVTYADLTKPKADCGE